MELMRAETTSERARMHTHETMNLTPRQEATTKTGTTLDPLIVVKSFREKFTSPLAERAARVANNNNQ